MSYFLLVMSSVFTDTHVQITYQIMFRRYNGICQLSVYQNEGKNGGLMSF